MLKYRILLNNLLISGSWSMFYRDVFEHTHTHFPWQFRLCLFLFLLVGRKHTRTHAMTVHGNFACYCQPALYDTTFMRSTLMSFLAYVTFLPLHLHTALETKMNTVMNLSKSIIFSHDLNNRKTNETSSYLILKKCKSLLIRVCCE